MSFLPLYLEMVGIKFVNDLHITLNLKSRGSKALLTMFKKSSVLVERASLRDKCLVHFIFNRPVKQFWKQVFQSLLYYATPIWDFPISSDQRRRTAGWKAS